MTNLKKARMAEIIRLMTRLKDVAESRGSCMLLYQGDVIKPRDIVITETSVSLLYGEYSRLILVSDEVGYDEWLDMTLPQIRNSIKSDFKLLLEIKW